MFRILHSLSRIPLWFQIFFIAGLASLLGIGAVGVMASRMIASQLEEHLGEHVMSLSWTVAHMPVVQESLAREGADPELRKLLDAIRKKVGVAFIVPVRGERKDFSLRERASVGRVLGNGEAYLARGAGPLGPSLRALTPVIWQGRQVGAVSVGMLVEDVRTALQELSRKLGVALMVGLSLALGGAVLVAWNVKRSLWGLEPEEIGRLHGERESMLESIKEGILAVDRQGRITLLNNSARELLRVSGDIRGEPVELFLPDTRLPEVLRTGEPEFDMEMLLRGIRVMTNRIPIRLRGRVIGAVASFRDMTEIQALAEEVTGVKVYLEALRVQHHEFRNKLQTISGLVQLGETHRVLDFIDRVVDGQDTLASMVTERIKNPEVGGILLGKMGRARELGISFVLDSRSFCGRDPGVSSQTLVVILGNLLDNAMEAVRFLAPERRTLRVFLYDEPEIIRIEVEDSGTGISPEVRHKIFDRGFSTKPGENPRGYGLYTVRTLVDAQGGEIRLESSKRGKTLFIVELSKKEESL